MNFDADYRDFKEVWTNAHAVMSAGNKNLSEIAIESIFDDLEDYPLEVIKQCVKRHRKTAQFAPTPFDIITMINESKGNKHLGVEEAWAKALPMINDEDSSFIVTKEIMEAFGLAESLYLDGDKFSAARAFKEKYASLIKNAAPPVWFVTMGNDKQRRIEAINEASRLNLLTNQHASELMLGLDKPTTSVDALLENHAKKTNAENAKANLAGLKLIIDNTKPEKSRSELLKEHEVLLREQHQQKLQQLRDLYPDECVSHDAAEEVSV